MCEWIEHDWSKMNFVKFVAAGQAVKQYRRCLNCGLVLSKLIEPQVAFRMIDAERKHLDREERMIKRVLKRQSN